MPTINQLPLATRVAPEDVVPISQSGVTRNASVGLLLANAQPAIVAPQNVLLGRTSPGPGGPEPVQLGLGLGISAGRLAATGADHAAFPQVATLSETDELVLNSAAGPGRVKAAQMRGLFTAGTNVTIDSKGTISAAAGGGAYTLPPATATTLGGVKAGNGIKVAADGTASVDLPSAAYVLPVASASERGGVRIGTGLTLIGDVINVPAPPSYTLPAATAITLGGVKVGTGLAVAADGVLSATGGGGDAGIQVADLPPVLTPQPTDLLPIEQMDGLNGLSLAQLNGFMQAQPRRLVEEPASTVITRATHMGALVLCSGTGITTLTTAFADLGPGFWCDVINVGTGTVFFGSGFVASGGTGLPANGLAPVRAVQLGSAPGIVLAATPSASTSGSSGGTGAAAFVGVLDGMASAPSAAYSVRRLLSSYTGPAMRVVSSTGALVRIGFTATGDLDLAALAAAAGSGSALVETWYDQVGALDLTQSDAGQQPRIVNTGGIEAHPGAGGRPGLRFFHSGAVNRLLNYSANIGGPLLATTVICAPNDFLGYARVLSYIGAGLPRYDDADNQYLESAAIFAFGGYNKGFRAFRNKSLAQQDVFPDAYGIPSIVSTVYDGATQRLFLNGTQRASSGSSGNFGGAGSIFAVGAHNGDSQLDQAFRGHIGELVVWKGVTDADRSKVETATRAYFGNV